MGILNVDHTIISSEEVGEREESCILVNSLIDDNVLTYEWVTEYYKWSFIVEASERLEIVLKVLSTLCKKPLSL